MSALTTSETLNLAADLIEERGWVRGSYTGTRICLERALSLASEGPESDGAWEIANTCPAGMAVRDYLSLGPWAKSGAVNNLWNWNDSKAKDAAEVIAVLRATAVIESAREVRTTLAGLPGSEAPA